MQQQHLETVVKAQDGSELSILCLGFTAGRGKQRFSLSFQLVNGPQAFFYLQQDISIKINPLEGHLSRQRLGWHARGQCWRVPAVKRGQVRAGHTADPSQAEPLSAFLLPLRPPRNAFSRRRNRPGSGTAGRGQGLHLRDLSPRLSSTLRGKESRSNQVQG